MTTYQASRGIGIKHTKIMRHRPEQGDLLLVAGVGWHQGVVGTSVLGTDLGSAPGQALQTRQAVIVYDLPNDPRTRYPAVLRDHGIISALNVPIVVNGTVWGVLEVDSETPRQFGDDDSSFLFTLANILGLALNGRLRLQHANKAAADATAVAANQQTLFEELQHRSRNDFQLVQSLLLIQLRKLAAEDARESLSQVMDRITAVGMVHEQLTPVRARGRVELDEYLAALCRSLALRKEHVRVETELARTVMPHEKAVVLGLIVNELVTNAFKYAFPGERGGTVSVSFATNGGEGTLTVQDDGVGMGPARPGSLGTRLIQTFVQQVGGTLEGLQQPIGAGFRISFPLVS